MWQVFYTDGKTIREDSGQDWVDIPKTGMTAVQMIWEPFDWIPYLREQFNFFKRLYQTQWVQLEALLEVNFQDYGTLNKAFRNSIGRTTGGFRKCAESIKVSIEEKYIKAIELFNETKDPIIKKKAENEAAFLNNFLTKIKHLSSGIGSYQHQLDKVTTFKGDGDLPVFFQHKHHVTSATRIMGQIINERIAQEVGKVYNKAGDYISATMYLNNGYVVITQGNVHKVGLNLELHGIDLEVLP